MSLVITEPKPPVVPVRSGSGGGGGEFPVRRIYCVGRNYVEHAKEMGFTGREPPFFFLKPADAVLPVREGEVGRMPYPTLTGDLHHEVELVVAIGKGGSDIRAADALDHVWGYARRPRHDAPRPAGRHEEAGPAVVHRQGASTIRRRSASCARRPNARIGAGNGDPPRRERQAAPAEHDRQADLEPARDHRAPVGGLDAGARRPDLHRHARRRRRGEPRRPAARRSSTASARSKSRSSEHRRAVGGRGRTAPWSSTAISVRRRRSGCASRST